MGVIITCNGPSSPRDSVLNPHTGRCRDALSTSEHLFDLLTHVCCCVLNVDTDGAGYMFDSGQRSYISKQVGESEQGALQGTLLSISLLTAAISSFLSNSLFSFFLSTAFVKAFGQNFLVGNFLSRRCASRLPIGTRDRRLPFLRCSRTIRCSSLKQLRIHDCGHRLVDETAGTLR